MLSEEKKFRQIIKQMLQEADTNELLVEKTLSDAFIKPFANVFKVAKVALKDILTVAKFNWDILVTFDPVKLANLKKNFKERRKLIKKDYEEAMGPIKEAMGGDDVKLAAFMLNPVGYLGAAALKAGIDNAPGVVDFFKEAGFGATIVGTSGEPTAGEAERSGGKIKAPVGVVGTAMKALRKLFFIEESRILPAGVVLLREKTDDDKPEASGFDIDASTAQALDDLGILDLAEESSKKVIDDAKKSNEEFLDIFMSNLEIAQELTTVKTYEQLNELLENAKSKQLDIAQSVEGLNDMINDQVDKLLSNQANKENFIRALAAKNGNTIPEGEPIPEEFLNAPEDKLREEAMVAMFVESTESLREKAEEIKQEISEKMLEEYEIFRNEIFEDYGVDESSLKFIQQTPVGKEFMDIFKSTKQKIDGTRVISGTTLRVLEFFLHPRIILNNSFGGRDK